MARDEGKLKMVLQELVRRTNDEGRRLRELEQRITALEEKTNSLESISLDKMKKFNDKLISNENIIREMSNDISKLKIELDKIIKSASKFAKKRDIKELERMFDLLNPIKQEFVTKDELKEIAKR